MNFADEARYGRASLLILNVCPFTLRHVIDDYHLKNGYTSLQDFLDKNKHDLYHILNRKCCCRTIQSRVTPMNRSQWDILFIRNSSSCRTGYTGDCPCQYDAKPGVTSDVMDITLCCLFIKNICSRHVEINMAHIETIRTIRNHIIHAESAQLDLLTYNGYWNRIRFALLDLANNLSQTVHTDTLSMIQDLETRMMNVGELGEIRKVLVDQKRMEEVEENVSDIKKDIDTINENVGNAEENVSQLEENVNQLEGHVNQLEGNVSHLQGTLSQVEGNVSHLERNIRHTEGNVSKLEGNVNQTRAKLIDVEGGLGQTSIQLTKLEETVTNTTESSKRKISNLEEAVDQKIKQIRQEVVNPGADNLTDEEPDVRRLKQRLIKVNNDFTKVITLSPLQERGNELPIELLFAQVVIREDPKYTEKGNKSESRFGIDTSNRLPVSDRNGESDRSFDTSTDSDSDSADTDIDIENADTDSDLDNADTDINSVSDSDSQRIFRRMPFQHKRESVNPYDIFKIDDEISSNVYMLGDAAHGKTTYCKWLVRKWWNAQHEDSMERDLDVWEKALKEFDFVFLLLFRNVNPNRACVLDMICHDVSRSLKGCHAAIRHVLTSDKYKSLVIMDGLDEWNPNEETRKQLACQGMPNLDELSCTVTSFISMRSWFYPSILTLVQMNDRVIEILGLSKNGMKQVIKDVLLNRYKLRDNSSKFKDLYERITMYLREKSLKSFMQIPLLAVVCVQIWYEGKQVGDSMTSFYAEMLDMLIERAYEKHEFEIKRENLIDDTLPEILSEHERIKDCISILLKLGKIAYEGLISDETNIEFQKRKLEKEIGIRELQFALDVGLISQKEAPSLTKKNVSVSFFHKSIQEFLAAVYIVTKKDVGESFRKYLSDVNVVMELSNVIMFICGMCPSLGSVISQHVVSVTDNDTSICEYRELPDQGYYCFVNENLYKLQINWYKELQDRNTQSPVTFHTSDVHLSCDIIMDIDEDKEAVTGTRELLSDRHLDIRSLYFELVPTSEDCGITNAELYDFLCNEQNTKSLVMVYIDGEGTGRSVPPLCIPSLRFLELHDVTISNNTNLNGNVCPPLLTQMASLRVLVLCFMTLCDRGLDLSDMTSLHELRLWHVNLGDRGLDLSDMTSLQKLNLTNVILGDRGLNLSHTTSLRELELLLVTLGDRGLLLSTDMVHIENVILLSLNMSSALWQQLIMSILNIKHTFSVELHGTNIDDELKTNIRYSPDFNVTWDDVGGFVGMYLFRFTRVWPLSHSLHDEAGNEILYTRL